MPFVPGQLKQERELEPLYEDVPPHLRQQLMDWVTQFFDHQVDYYVPSVANHLRFDYSRAPQAASWSTPNGNMRQYITKRCHTEPETHLQVIEHLLAVSRVEQWARQLETHLRLGNSLYAVKEDARGLEYRADPVVRSQVQEVVTTAVGSAGEHLANAWDEAYGRQSDPVKSFSESIKAVEAAMAPIVSPNDLLATLGRIIGNVKSNPGGYKFAIQDGSASGVQTVLTMMRLLWDGQTSRHGGNQPTRSETVEEAKAAVHLAAALVQYGSSRAFDVS